MCVAIGFFFQIQCIAGENDRTQDAQPTWPVTECAPLTSNDVYEDERLTTVVEVASVQQMAADVLTVCEPVTRTHFLSFESFSR